MAAGNKTLGRFSLSGIAPAPRGIPQIEVTFDIDANGIVNVSAKDLGTGNEQKVTITASTNLSKDDIDAAVKEAEKFAEEDKKKKEDIDTRNQADATVYQAEKMLKDMGDKMDAGDKSSIENACNGVKEALKGTDLDAVKAAMETLTQAIYAVSEKVYKQTGAQPGAENPGAGTTADGQTYYDADFTEVDDNK